MTKTMNFIATLRLVFLRFFRLYSKNIITLQTFEIVRAEA